MEVIYFNLNRRFMYLIRTCHENKADMFCLGQNCLFVVILLESGCEIQSRLNYMNSFMFWVSFTAGMISFSVFLHHFFYTVGFHCRFSPKKCDAVVMFVQSLVVNQVSLHFCCRLITVSVVVFSLSLQPHWGGRLEGEVDVGHVISLAVVCL